SLRCSSNPSHWQLGWHLAACTIRQRNKNQQKPSERERKRDESETHRKPETSSTQLTDKVKLFTDEPFTMKMKHSTRLMSSSTVTSVVLLTSCLCFFNM
ncbi:unnamed protein product, partial [Acanthoscelides obtectus]